MSEPVFNNGIILRETSYLSETMLPFNFDINHKFLGEPVDIWKMKRDTNNVPYSKLINTIMNYCKNRSLSIEEFAANNHIHMRSMRGFLNGHKLDDMTYMRMKYGISEMSKEDFIHWITICKKDKKYKILYNF